MYFLKSLIITILLLISLPLRANNSLILDYIHDVKRGDTLGRILSGIGHNTLWGRGNYVEFIGNYNQLQDVNHIKEKQQIKIPFIFKYEEVVEQEELCQSPLTNDKDSFNLSLATGLARSDMKKQKISNETNFLAKIDLSKPIRFNEFVLSPKIGLDVYGYFESPEHKFEDSIILFLSAGADIRIPLSSFDFEISSDLMEVPIFERTSAIKVGKAKVFKNEFSVKKIKELSGKEIGLKIGASNTSSDLVNPICFGGLAEFSIKDDSRTYFVRYEKYQIKSLESTQEKVLMGVTFEIGE